MFQSTRPRGARRRNLRSPPCSTWFQSTRPRGARLTMGLDGVLAALVSIHAPARGATNTPPRLHLDPNVSIHAPARGATASDIADERQSRVSIHAPARGATLRIVGKRRHDLFQSTRPRGARRGEMNAVEGVHSFNPRARAGRDMPIRSEWYCSIPCFNPRARAGRDAEPKVIIVHSIVSIHAPARGATWWPLQWGSWLRVSIHAPARGATSPCLP